MSITLSGDYQALARKYRPQVFEDVVGQKHVLSALANAIDTRRVHHAYLLTGTRGIGKTTIARIMAKSLECEQGESSHPCGCCNACRGITAGSFPDVIEIDAASQTKVDDTRQLLENTQYPPISGRYKIYIIDEVHMLSQSSFNALLKTLEEPPSYVKFILATTDPHKIPTTVLSRCLQFQLKALSVEEIQQQIQKITASEGLTCESEGALLIARAARGSMRDALSLCDQAVALGRGAVRREVVLSMLGTVGDSVIAEVLDSLDPKAGIKLGDLLSRITQISPNYHSLIDELTVALHDLALFQFIGGSKLNVFSLPLEMLEKYAPKFTAQQLQLYYQICIEGLREFDYAPDGKSAFEMTLLRLHAFTPEKKKDWLNEKDAENLAAAQAAAVQTAPAPQPPASSGSTVSSEFNYNQPLDIQSAANSIAVLNAPSSPAAGNNSAFMRPEAQQSALKSRPLSPDSQEMLRSLQPAATPQQSQPQPPAAGQLSAGAQAVARAAELLNLPVADPAIQAGFSRCLQALSYLIDLKQASGLLRARQHRQKGADPTVRQIAGLAALAAQPPGQMPPAGSQPDSTAQAGQELPAAPVPAASADIMTAPMSLEEARRINQAVDQRMQQEQAAEPVSPLAGNFATESGAPSASPVPAAPADIMTAPMSPEESRRINQAVDQRMQQEQATEPALPQQTPQYPAPPGVLPAGEAAAAVPPQPENIPPQALPDAVAVDAGPVPPDYLQDLPPLEDDDYAPAGALAEGEDEFYARQGGPDLLLAADPASQPAAVPPPPQPYTEPAGKFSRSGNYGREKSGGRGQSTLIPRGEQTLPTGYRLPHFPSLRPLGADDYYPQLEQSDPWYKLIAACGFKNGPDLNALLFSALQHGPDAQGNMALSCSLDHRDYIEGSGAVQRFNQQFSQYFGRPVQVIISYVPGVPDGAPCAAVNQALQRDIAARRQELSREAWLQGLCNLMGENLNELPLQLYVPENSAESR